MRRWILLAIVIGASAWGGLTLFRQYRRNSLQRHREKVWSETYGAAKIASMREKPAQAESILVPLLPQAESWWPGGLHVFQTIVLLGVSYQSDHKHDQAEPLFRRALEMSSTLKGVDSNDLARAKFGLAVIARDRNQDVEAQQLFSEALDLFEKNPVAARGTDAGALMNLGFLCTKRGQYQEAESFLKRAIARYEVVLGGLPHGDLASAHFQLASLYRLQNRDKEAAEQFQESIDMSEKVEGPNSLNVGREVQGLAVATEAQGKHREAQKLLERSRKIEKSQAARSGTPDGVALDALATIAAQEGKYAEAVSLYKRSISAYEKSNGPDDPDIAIPLTRLGCLYRDQEQLDIRVAEPLLKRALAIREKALGHDHALTAETTSDLALLYFFEKKFADAEKVGIRVLPVQEKIFGQNGLEVSTTLNRLGMAERELGKFPQAEANLKRALSIREKALAPNHAWIALSLENLASVYAAEGQYDKVAPLITRARAIRAHSSGD
jgi:tetratricopeptide (TPR) repeat protein